ncbi:MAG: DUF4013 domain-containing protein [Methanobrevibacter sp.]|nr:DUF4013 domain-containing protein [Methanobrevibacter sp.]
MSDLVDIFKEALIYPISNIIVLLTIGLLLVVSNLTGILYVFGIDLYNSAFSFILSIISFIIIFLLAGYTLSVIRDAISYNVSVPKIDFKKNFVDGIKVIILEIIYYIIPAIITIIVGFLSGTFGAISNIIVFFSENQGNLTVGNYTANQLIGAIPPEYVNSLMAGLTITAIVAIIVFIIFGLLAQIGICRLAKYDSFSEALRFGQIIADIRKIGIGKYIGWYILLFILIIVLSIVVAIITAIPFIGVILSYLVCLPFLFLFTSRAIGLLYLRAQ